MKFLLLILLLVGCTNPLKNTSKAIVPVKAAGHGSAFQIVQDNKYYMITAAHVCGENKKMRIGKHLYKVHRLNIMDDVCVLTGKYQSDMVSFKISKRAMPPATEFMFSGFPMNSVRERALEQKGLSGRKTVLINSKSMERLQHVFGLIIGGNSGGPAYIGDTLFGIVVRGNMATDGFIVPPDLVLKTVKGFETKKECGPPQIVGNIPVVYLYNMMIPGCLRKSKSCVKAIIERGPMNYHVICEKEEVIGSVN